MKFSHLSTDIIDSILISLSDFHTLLAAILISKRFHNVFRGRPKSIIRAVAHNIAGPVLPLALEIARLQDDPDTDDSEAAKDVADMPPNANVAAMLVANAKVVRELEDIFSWRNKDRTSKTSRLTAQESDRFHRATYRFWLYTIKSRDEDDDDDDDNDEDEDEENASRYNQKLLRAYPTPELYELKRIAAFLSDLLVAMHTTNSIYDLHITSVSPYLLRQGPASILNAYRGHTLTPLVQWHHSIHDFFWNAFGKVCATRGISEEKWRSEDSQILDEVIGGSDTCHSCLAVTGLKLWGPTTWELLHESMSPREMCNFLEGNLPANPWETMDIISALRTSHGVTFDYANMLGEMMELEADSGGVWDKQEWYCMNCVEGLFRTRFREWWLAKKLRDGAPVLENCWYGYNCRTQQHRQYHAERLNHLCVPTQGDAPSAN